MVGLYVWNEKETFFFLFASFDRILRSCWARIQGHNNSALQFGCVIELHGEKKNGMKATMIMPLRVNKGVW